MARLVFTEGFLQDAARVSSPDKLAEIERAVRLLEDFPELGSRNVPRSVEARHGGGLRRLSVPPFVVVYRWLEEDGEVAVLGMMHGREAW